MTYIVTEEGFRTILLELAYPEIVIDYLWDGRPSGEISEDRVREIADTVKHSGMIGVLETMLLAEDKHAT